jgi:hypothetical protein
MLSTRRCSANAFSQRRLAQQINQLDVRTVEHESRGKERAVAMGQAIADGLYVWLIFDSSNIQLIDLLR